MTQVRRIYVEKKVDYAIQAKELREEMANYLNIQADKVRVLIRYDIENISDEAYQKALGTVFSEPPVDDVYEESFPKESNDFCFSVEYLPGQFDQRADSAVQCVRLLGAGDDVIIKSAITYVISGNITEEQRNAIVKHCINPVDSRQTDEVKPNTLVDKFDEPADVVIFDGFKEMDEKALKEFYDGLGLAMTFRDMQHIQRYFRDEEKRNPTMTEIRVLDTYWSDHCRHTTFATELKNVTFDEGKYRPLIEGAFQQYLSDHKEQYVGRDDKFVCLMDMGTLAAKRIRKMGLLEDQEISEEINACSIVVPIEVELPNHEGVVTEEWLVNFKNETHNHPTEIEPFGGAATCLGGAIRDPLSGRTYVYQAMRVTGAADPTKPLSETIPGKLPQRKIVTTAAHGYSSYGNQIGLATGLVNEIYHPNYVAKRMEIGAVVAAAPRRQVMRMTSDPGDVIILLGGRTGRDGCGGATGSSKSHTTESLTSCGAEVQKGNAPTERKLQRMFRREEVSKLIKKCNDFGAGGVSVAIGELADGLDINLDRVPKKYAGLDGTELAISESQERMAIVVDPKNVDQMLAYAEEENLEAVVVATVTEEPRMVIKWRGKTIVNLSRRFIDTNGAHQETEVKVTLPDESKNYFTDVTPAATFADTMKQTLSDLNVCSQKGLVEMFDSTIGANTVVMPYGGVTQMSPAQAMVAKIPVVEGKTDACTIMSYGFDPYLSSWSPYHGAAYAVLQSVAKVVATGADPTKVRLTFQEYFKKLGNNPERWGQPFAALLGAYNAQMGLKLPAIGGKDSMSGTFNDIDVPPTLCSFAIAVDEVQNIVTTDISQNGGIYEIEIKRDQYGMPDYEDALLKYRSLHKAIRQGKIVASHVVGFGGILEAVAKMAFGSRLGVVFNNSLSLNELMAKNYGNILIQPREGFENSLPFPCRPVAVATYETDSFHYGDESLTLDEALEAWTRPLEDVFPTRSSKKERPFASADSNEQFEEDAVLDTPQYEAKEVYICKHKVARPKVFIPAFPGTNCEYDSARAFERAGAEVETLVFRNMNDRLITDSIDSFTRAIKESQIIMIPGGFSAGDEPEGSAKFITSVFRNAKVADAVMEMLQKRDGLMIGICNGFQALVKLGLVPYGEIRPQTADSPTLTFNTIGRHQSKIAYTRVVSNLSPWLQRADMNTAYSVPISHGEGRFVANKEWLDRLFKNGQVATQYVDIQDRPTMNEEFNMNGSYLAIEGITSPDGRILGKMAHSERRSDNTYLNIWGEQDQQIFESGVEYFL
ncbi:MAG: phosphoribosylformylglycinamidine synthase [Bacteroidales bacterium]|nr:phosphoribosylformylglycinamidine synthase [Bacteroidales bacterium]